MKQLGYRFHNYIKKASFWKGVGVFLAVTQGSGFVFGLIRWVASTLGIDVPGHPLFELNDVDVISKGAAYLLRYSVFGPVMETVFYQVIPIRLMLMVPRLKERPGCIILIGGLLFGLMHFYHLTYIAVASFAGMVFAYMYYLYYTRYQEEGDSVPPEKKIPPFWPVYTVHALHNAIFVIVNLASWM